MAERTECFMLVGTFGRHGNNPVEVLVLGSLGRNGELLPWVHRGTTYWFLTKDSGKISQFLANVGAPADIGPISIIGNERLFSEFKRLPECKCSFLKFEPTELDSELVGIEEVLQLIEDL